ncbi:antibiotic biosynthesis monooxygenase (plasmid) [Ensifer adhaerens]|uniref:antibiotic biosynthesis monooxygenase family protein n=1 Tax=Ensifer adhaerens TaxID=106592 RepID=UPI001CBDFE77|nr:antibiotic biosynthesis monooxygenase family protein [Ensifer adhaerens]MBZ7927165.1 antibiotic biosynthesis monooxygenase [Ensifer adhaerens]UAX98201.1 antibiotic biosynthesis monooxygenase [Ensifer adhaerens]UAY05583.1 antibiotic biosynthesis monooxygenase [Ensifer adhaerens]UAY12961.1 antibiotic biosynthesis monooxygenase [Ensifer adhaerens]
MIRSVLSLTPKVGASQDLVQFFEDREIPQRALATPGCLGVEVQTLLPDGGEVLVTALWTSASSYRAWLESAGRLEDGALMRPLLAGGGEVVAAARLYDIGQRAARPD